MTTATLLRRVTNQPASCGLIGESAIMQQLRLQIMQCAPMDSTVLISGETGTGKELIARVLHAQANRPGEFVAINCAAIPADLIEAELFGYVGGAFTGANRERIGHIEHADKGTLFFDEIGDMPYALQAKLLRFLQERTFSKVGSCRQQKSSVRVIAATHQPLSEQVTHKQFRADLYYRLAVIQLTAPRIKDHINDLPLLIDSLTKRIARRLGVAPIRFAPQAIHAFLRYEWPGNVRELENLIESLSVFQSGHVIDVMALPKSMTKHFHWEWAKLINQGASDAVHNPQSPQRQLRNVSSASPPLSAPLQPVRASDAGPTTEQNQDQASQAALKEERWLPIPGYEGHYEVSTHGQVRSLARYVKLNKESRQYVHGKRMCIFGYQQVRLSLNRQAKTYKVDKLLLAALAGKPLC